MASLQVLTPEALATAIRSATFETCQLSSGPAPSRLARLLCPGVCLDFMELGPAMLFTGVMPADCYTLIFVTKCSQPGRAFNFATEHTDGYMGFFPPGGELDAFTPEGYANATLTVPTATFLHAIERGAPEIPDRILKQGAGMRIGNATQKKLRGLLSAVMMGIEDPAAPFSSLPARCVVEAELLVAFVETLRNGLENLVARPKRRTTGKLQRLRQARDFIQTTAHDPLHIEEVSHALGMSPRGVEALFQDSLGIGPNAYIRHTRLHGVRRELLKAAPRPGIVKELAIRWGFWHMGHFSASYRSLFGENPSATLARGSLGK